MSLLSPSQIALLSPAERLALIGDLWDSLTDEQAALSEPQRAEIERRLQSFESDSAHGVSWDQLKAEISKRAS